MKAKQLIILIICCVIICIIGGLVMRQNQADWKPVADETTDRLFPDFPANDIRRLAIRTKDKSVELARKENRWTVASHHGYAADFKKIAGFLRKVTDLKVTHVIEAGENAYGRLELNGPDKEEKTGTLVEFFDRNDSLVSKVVLGKQHMKKPAQEGAGSYGGGYPDGRYLLKPQSGTVALVAEAFSDISDSSDNWLDKTFFKLDKIKRGTAKQGNTVVWSVKREAENDSLELELPGAIGPEEEFDKSEVSQVDSALRYPSFNKIADPATSDDELGFAGDDTRRFIAESFDGFTYTVDVGKKLDDGDYPMRVAVAYLELPMPEAPEDETPEDKGKRETGHKEKVVEAQEKFKAESDRFKSWTYLVSSYTITDLILERKDFVKAKEKEDDASAGGEPQEDVNAEGSGKAAAEGPRAKLQAALKNAEGVGNAAGDTGTGSNAEGSGKTVQEKPVDTPAANEGG